VLALTENAVSAVNMILVQARVPEGSGVRIAPVPDDVAGGPASNGAGMELQLSVVEEPEQGDQVIEEQPVFLDPEATAVLNDKLLDAEINDDQVRFLVAQQA